MAVLREVFDSPIFVLNEYTVGIDILLRLPAVFCKKVCSAAQLRSLVIRRLFAILYGTVFA